METSGPHQVRDSVQVMTTRRRISLGQIGLSVTMLILPGDQFLEGHFGNAAVIVFTVIPFALFAYWTLVPRALLSNSFHEELANLLRLWFQKRLYATVFLASCGLFLVSIARSGISGTIGTFSSVYELTRWIGYLLLLVAIAGDGAARKEQAFLLKPFIVSYTLAAVVNALLIAFGIENSLGQGQIISAPELAVVLKAFGIEFTRRVLPIGSGSWGIHNGLGVAMGVAMLFSLKDVKARAVGFALVGSSSFCLLVSDSRGGMLAGVVGALSVLMPPMFRRRSHFLALIVPFLPLLLLFTIQMLVGSEVIDGISRKGETSGLALSGRPAIWLIVASFLAQPELKHLWGFGAMGQVASGVGSQYGPLLAAAYATTEGAGAHNTLLQSILDVGYTGAALQISCLWFCLQTASQSVVQGPADTSWNRIVLAGTVALIILGITDATLQANARNTLAFFFVANIYCLTHDMAWRQRELRRRLPKNSTIGSETSMT